MTAAKAPVQPASKPAAGGVRLVRAFPKAEEGKPEQQMARLSLDGKPVTNGVAVNQGNKTKAPAGPTAEEQWNKVVEAHDADKQAAAKAVAAQLAACDPSAPGAVAGLVKSLGIVALYQYGILDRITQALTSEDAMPLDRQSALQTYLSLCKELGRAVEPVLLPLLPAVLDRCGDRASSVIEAANTAAQELIAELNPYAAKSAVGLLLTALSGAQRWQTQAAALRCLAALARRAQTQVAHCTLDIVPKLSELMLHARNEVSSAATDAMLASCLTVGNRDLEPHVPAIVGCIAKAELVPEVIAKLSATTFVQAIEDGALGVMVPLLTRALRERSTTVKRRATIIIENMCKLVKSPEDAHPFLPLLIPALNKVSAEASDPELREVAGRAHALLVSIKDADDKQQQEHAAHPTDAAACEKQLRAGQAAEAASGGGGAPGAAAASVCGPATDAIFAHVAAVASALIACHVHGTRSWESSTVPYLESLLGGHAAAIAVGHSLQRWAAEQCGVADADEEEDAENELCNCEFSLAYGGKILLQDARLRLVRGRRYGLCGANGVGKSTLMKAISVGQLDGFPPKDQLRTVYVAHDIDASESQVSSVDFVFSDKVVQEATAPTREAVAAMLGNVGFSQQLQDAPIASLSGGWKMKLALARAMLMRADVLLLDEPTNHLDVTNVAWLENFLISSPDISSMIVSHDSGFLDNVCTDIIDYCNRKLTLYKGNLSEFVKAKPEAKSYYELSAASTKFKFPDPGFLDGIKGKSQSIIRLQQASFTYPGAPKPQLTDVTVRCGLGARVAVLGANGAGKSTLIKMITGETEPTSGTVWRHPNLRVAYVAQHAFHHVELHLTSTPSEYIWWRYGSGEDREAAAKVTRKMTEAEVAEREAAIAAGKRVVDYLNSRRKAGKGFEYEVVWVGQTNHPRNNSWLPRESLVEMGYAKMCTDLDARLAGLMKYRPLSTPTVMAHLADFGLPEDTAAHTAIKGLSGGQKVKLVLAGAMWSQPHLLVLDEPTNYLDRESLGALASAINEFQGGVIMISHNTEFWSALTNEQWLVENHRCTVTKLSGMQAAASTASLASMVSSASLASLASLGGGSEATGDDDDAELDEEALAERQRKKEEKARRAAEKAAKIEAKKKLKYARRF